jgi:hypothetical protein
LSWTEGPALRAATPSAQQRGPKGGSIDKPFDGILIAPSGRSAAVGAVWTPVEARQGHTAMKDVIIIDQAVPTSIQDILENIALGDKIN